MVDNLISLIYLKDYSSIKVALNEGVDINMRDSDGRTVLMHAVLDSDASAEMIRFLIQHGANIGLCDHEQKWTALHFAARDQKVEIVRELIANGAFVDAEDIFGNTPLWRCVMNQEPNRKLLKELLANGADPSKKNEHGVAPIDIVQNVGNNTVLALLSETNRAD